MRQRLGTHRQPRSPPGTEPEAGGSGAHGSPPQRARPWRPVHPHSGFLTDRATQISPCFFKSQHSLIQLFKQYLLISINQSHERPEKLFPQTLPPAAISAGLPVSVIHSTNNMLHVLRAGPTLGLGKWSQSSPLLPRPSGGKWGRLQRPHSTREEGQGHGTSTGTQSAHAGDMERTRWGHRGHTPGRPGPETAGLLLQGCP